MDVTGFCARHPIRHVGSLAGKLSLQHSSFLEKLESLNTLVELISCVDRNDQKEVWHKNWKFYFHVPK